MCGLHHYKYSLKGNLETMIQIQSLSHRYPKAETAALDNVSFDIADGECLGLLGHNGAGKTTLMSLLAGLQEVRQGEILFDGKPLRLLSRSERQKIGLVPQDFAFYPQLSVWDNLLFFRLALQSARQRPSERAVGTDRPDRPQKQSGKASFGRA